MRKRGGSEVDDAQRETGRRASVEMERGERSTQGTNQFYARNELNSGRSSESMNDGRPPVPDD